MAYDIYGDGDEACQMKVGDPDFSDYRVGDYVPIADGAYVAYEGIVVVKDGKLVAIVGHLYTKWGDHIRKADLINTYSPTVAAVRDVCGAIENEADETSLDGIDDF